MLDKTFDPTQIEARHYDRWEKSGAFSADPGREGVTPYCIMMPPPNVTGSLHMGHALTFTLQDILIRYHRMRGFDTLWQPGTDHAGIATQMVVERQLEAKGESRRDLGREAFIERVWAWKAESGGQITNQLRHLGASPDWPRERFTMDDGLSHAVRKVFVALYQQGLIYRDKRLVNWDPKLHTAISDLEVVQKEIKGNLWHFRYPLAEDPSRFITVATTRPETMLGDTGVAVHPEDERYKDLIGKMVRLPIVERLIPIVADDYADPETGSGAVKITPAHDFNDFEVGRRNDLPMINIFTETAHLNDQVPQDWQGLERFAARKRVVATFEELGLLEKVDEHVHMVPHGDRSGVPIEPFLTDQWYCDALTLAKPAIEAVEQGKTRFVPQNWENTYYEWMRNIQPWCISRQLWWGHQIPAWYGPDGTVFVAVSEAEAVALARDHYGDKYGTQPVLTRDQDVLDTWFSSALWPFSTLGWPEETPELARYYPGDVLVTGFDIIFFWVARMMMMGLHFMGEVPFRTVYIHALVRDAHGQKMSKSKGNVIDPLDLISRYGADALRFTLAALAAQGRDIKLAESRVEGYRNFCTKLWNASRFCEMNDCRYVSDFDPTQVTLTLSRWILGEASRVTMRVSEALDAYKFNEAAHQLYQFTWHNFCDWYVEFAKPYLYGEDAAVKAETQAVAGWVLDRILHLLHPFMPSLTEELWSKLGMAAVQSGDATEAGEGEALLIRAPWPTRQEALEDESARAEIDWVIRVISQVRGVRAEMNVPPKAEIPLVFEGAGPDIIARIPMHRDLLQRLARLSEISVLEAGQAHPKGAAQVVVDEATLLLPIADVIDIDKERARLQKDLDKVLKEQEKITARLANQGFLAKAPPEVVEDLKERAEAQTAECDKLQAALERLEAL